MDLYSVLIHEIIRTTGMKLKNADIVKLEFKTLYVQFRNNPVGWRKVPVSESDEVPKSDVCIKAMCHTFLACLSRAAGSAIEAISLALHSRPSVWHIALRRGSTSSLSHFLELYGAASVAPM